VILKRGRLIPHDRKYIDNGAAVVGNLGSFYDGSTSA
jgi:hypothetical protein